MPRQPENLSKAEKINNYLYFFHTEIAKMATEKNLSVQENQSANYTVKIYKKDVLVLVIRYTPGGRIRFGYWEKGFAPRTTKAYKALDAYEVAEKLINQLK